MCFLHPAIPNHVSALVPNRTVIHKSLKPSKQWGKFITAVVEVVQRNSTEKIGLIVYSQLRHLWLILWIGHKWLIDACPSSENRNSVENRGLQTPIPSGILAE